MENASKALIIAGAILISILIIGIGMFLYQAAQAPITEAGSSMAGQAIQMFNAKFENYEGKQKGTNVKALISAVITNNISAEASRIVTVNSDNDTSAELSTYRASLSNSSMYNVSFGYNTEGYITSITISTGT